MRRRQFIRQSSVSLLGLGLLGVGKGNTFLVDGKRIEKRLLELAKFGVDEKGRGYRVAYTKGDVEGRAWFMELMKNAGLNPTIDAAGNIIGKRKGKNNALKPIGFGSHIDMVPDGGNYDGTVGSIGALEVIEVLNAQGFVTEHPLEVIVFADEEGGTVGSKAMTEGFTKEQLLQKSQSGLTLAEGIRVLGGNPDNLASCKRDKGAFHAWLELHIEQGGILEKEKIQIGVVQGIVGIVHWEVKVEGFANHAGATPMNMRQDALLAASKLVIAVNEVMHAEKGSHVGTVGKINAQPGAYNVIPGQVMLGLEIRDLSAAKIENLFTLIEKRAALIAKETGTKIHFDRQPNGIEPALTDARIQKAIDATAKNLGLSTKFMQSGAGHDSQHIASIAPAGMIFIPSIGGVSHSPKEFSTIADIENGVNVLLQTILGLDKA